MSIRARRWLALVLFVSLVVPVNGRSQDTAPADPLDAKTDDKDFKLDLSVPESPAFKALGVVPQEVIRPSSPQQLAAQLLNGVDPRGNIQTGVALDTAPYLLFFGNGVTLREYQDHYPVRLVARTQASLATTKGSSDDDKSVRVAVGGRITPWDRGDPRMDQELIACFRGKLNAVAVNRIQLEIIDLKESIITLQGELTRKRKPPEREPTELERQTAQAAIDSKKLQITAKEAELQKTTDTVATRCRDDARARNWNASSWAMGVAPTWVSPSGQVRDVSWDTASVWSSLGYGFEEIPGLADTSELLVSARYNHDEKVPDPVKSDGTFIEQRSLVAAFQLRLAVYRPKNDPAPALIVSAEGDYLYADPQHAKHDSSYRFSLGADWKIPDTHNTYLKVSAGGGGGSDRENNQAFVAVTLRYGS
jgi:hypothetical protein